MTEKPQARAALAAPCDCMPTPQMCRAAVEYVNGPEVYGKLPAKTLAIDEDIYAEVWRAMQAVAPKPQPGEVEFLKAQLAEMRALVADRQAAAPAENPATTRVCGEFDLASAPAPAGGSEAPCGWFEGPHGAFRANPAFRMVWPPRSLKWQVPVYLRAQAQPKETQADVSLTNEGNRPAPEPTGIAQEIDGM